MAFKVSPETEGVPSPQTFHGDITDLITERHSQQQLTFPAHPPEDFLLPFLGFWCCVGDHNGTAFSETSHGFLTTKGGLSQVGFILSRHCDMSGHSCF